MEAGHVFASNTDSETLVHGFEEWGEKLVDRLRGMYAFAIWDIKEKIICSPGHFRDQTALFCADEPDASVWFRD